MGLPVPYGCSLDDLQVEAEKAMRELSDVTAKIAVELPKCRGAPLGSEYSGPAVSAQSRNGNPSGVVSRAWRPIDFERPGGYNRRASFPTRRCPRGVPKPETPDALGAENANYSSAFNKMPQ